MSHLIFNSIQDMFSSFQETLRKVVCFSHHFRDTKYFENNQRMAKDYDYLLKVLLVGDSDVGKHEILSGLEDGSSESPFCSGSGKHCTLHVAYINRISIT